MEHAIPHLQVPANVAEKMGAREINAITRTKCAMSATRKDILEPPADTGSRNPMAATSMVPTGMEPRTTHRARTIAQ